MKVLGEGRFVRLVVDEGGWEFAQRTNTEGIVILVAVTEARRLLVVEQYRPPVQARVLELPAGLAGDLAVHSGESLATAAARELEEETGYRAAQFELLVEGPLSAGLSSEVVTVFRARGLERVGPGGGDATEDIAVHEVPLDGADAWLAAARGRGVLVDPKLYAALWFAARD